MTAWQLDPDHRVHLVGIGGAGMSALASILLQRGHQVSGSDLRGGRAASALSAMGASVSIGHDAAHVADAGVVVVSTAVPADNPEIVAAHERQIPVLRRAELLAALMEGHRAVLITGTHGKTTTTSMVTVALQAAGLDPSFAIGGMIHESGASAHHGADDVFIAEADESDRSFLAYVPDCAVITNVELDHHDVYTSLDDLLAAFRQFLALRRPGGPVIVCADDPGARRLAGEVDGPVISYGQSPGADVHLVDVTLDEGVTRCHVHRSDRPAVELSLRLPGVHNLLNAAAAIAVADWVGVDAERAAAGLGEFVGAQRRFQRLGTAAGVTVIDDYAHHPTEIAATLAAARQVAPAGRLIAVFQPHRYSRTAALATDLGRALAAADLAVVTDVYAAGEAPVPGVTGLLVADAATRAGVATRYVPSIDDIPGAVADLAGEGDLILTMGAGDITQSGPAVLAALGGT